MKRLMKTLSVLLLTGMTVAGCQTGDVLVEGATPFTRGELYAYLSNQTQERDGGGAFFSEMGTVVISKDGTHEEGAWSTTDDGEVCLHVKAWGEHAPCTAYYHNGSFVSTVDGDVTATAPKQYPGDVLEYVEAGKTPPKPEPKLDYVKVLFTPEEMEAFVTGKTVIWGNDGGAYYVPDHSLKTVWDGARVTGTWSVDERGGVCWQVPSWGTTPCEYHFYNGDVLWSEYKGKDDKSDKYVDGDQTGGM